MSKINSKILSPAQAVALCKKKSRAGKKIVFTNGCFDILHPGHVFYLEQARAKGDFLIVALDTDVSVRKLKGEGRPVNDLKSRQQVVAALESIDCVTSFSNSDPLPLIKKCLPKVLVKGGDWKISGIVGSKEVLAAGGKVYSLPFVKGKSTTNIIKKIKN